MQIKIYNIITSIAGRIKCERKVERKNEEITLSVYKHSAVIGT